MQLAQKPLERRAQSRRQISMKAIAKIAGFGGVPCTVVNVSPMGAMIVFEQPLAIPDTFVLLVPSCWFEAECEVRHRSADRAGVLFSSSRIEALARFS